MPPSCKDSTNPDNAVISPDLLDYITHVEVLTAKLFDAHEPVIFTIELPQEPLTELRYQVPKTWPDLPTQADHLQSAMDTKPLLFEEVNSYGDWNAAVENFVDSAIRDHCSPKIEFFPVTFLPKAYRGRHKPPKAKRFPRQSQVPKGRTGDYEPPGEVAQNAKFANSDASRASDVALSKRNPMRSCGKNLPPPSLKNGKLSPTTLPWEFPLAGGPNNCLR